MNDRPALAWLRDARRYILEAHNIASGVSEGEFKSSNRDQFAVQFCLVVVGEALNEVPKTSKRWHPKFPGAQSTISEIA
jgi:uncharacterized protein with HEPN domain